MGAGMSIDAYLVESAHLDRIEAGVDRLEAGVAALRAEVEKLADQVRRSVAAS